MKKNSVVNIVRYFILMSGEVKQHIVSVVSEVKQRSGRSQMFYFNIF